MDRQIKAKNYRTYGQILLTTLRLVVTAALLASTITTAGLLWLAWQVDRAGSGDPVQPTDAIVVLGARVMSNGEPGRDLYTRTRWAANLFHDLSQTDHNPVLITTGGSHQNPHSAAAVSRQLAIEWSVPPDRILVAAGGQNTAGDALYAQRMMEKHDLKSLTLVSHPLHLYRSRWHFSRVGAKQIRTYAAGNLRWIPLGARIYLSGREAAGVVWGMLEGWDRFERLGKVLEVLVYGRREL